jgi:toxin FitB
VFVLDTDVVSELRRRRPNPALVLWLQNLADEVASTAITIMEIRLGIEMARRTNSTVAEAVERWLADLLDTGGAEILPLDEAAAQVLGRMYATPALRIFVVASPAARRVKTGADLAIAAIAISRHAVVATNNVEDFLAIQRHFALPGLLNPFTGEWHVPPAADAAPH